MCYDVDMTNAKTKAVELTNETSSKAGAAVQGVKASPPKNLQQELGKKNPFELIEEEAYLNLARTADQLAGEVRTLLQSYGLSEPMYNALRIVGARGQNGIPSQSIAHDMVCRSPDMTSLVDRLCKAELVRRERSTQDRRIVMVIITPKGSTLLAKIKKPSQELIRGLLNHMNAKQLTTLNSLLFIARTPTADR